MRVDQGGVLRRAICALRAAGPLPLVFFMSLVLSYLALRGKVNPNADGILYVDAARLLLSDGLRAAQQLYDWLFLSVLIAGLSAVSGLDVQSAAYLLAAVLMAMVGVALVGITRELYPAATWAAVAVVLALPALNNYRDFIIREHGSWLFTLVSLWLLIRWGRSKGLLLVFGSQLSLLVAALFRPESLAFLSVPFLWLLFSRRSDLSWRDLRQFLILPACGVLALLVAVVGLDVSIIAGKLLRQLQAANLPAQLDAFYAAADRVGEQLSHYVMGADARRLLFVGLLSLIPIKFFTNLGLFSVPFLYAQGKQSRVEWTKGGHAVPLLWAAGLYTVILAGLVFEIYFMQARFLALLNLFFVPILALGLLRLWQVAGKWRWLVAFLAVVSAVDNVYTSSPPNTRYEDSAAWILEERFDRQRIFYEPPEVAYLSGAVHRIHPSQSCMSRALLLTSECQERFDLYVIRSGWGGDELLSWAEANGFVLLREFSDRRKAVVYVFERRVTR